MTTRKSARSAWWTDLSVPNLHGVLPAALVDTFTEWLGPELGRFRDGQMMRAARSQPALAAELATVQQTKRGLLKTSRALRDLPVHATAYLSSAAVRHRELLGGDGWHDIAKRIERDSIMLGGLLGIVEGALSAIKVKTGRPRTIERDALLRKIISKLREARIPAAEARSTAEQILVLSGIEVPEEDGSIKRAARRGKAAKTR